jgi:hypothetical protein
MNIPARASRADDTPILPREPEVERAILGAIIRREDPDQALQVRRELHGSAFTTANYREVFDCITEMAERGDAVNLITLAREMRVRGSSIKEAEIAALIDGVPFKSNLSTEIRILKETATRREILRCADAWYNEAQARDVNLTDLTRAIADRAAEFGQTRADRSKPISVTWGGLCDMSIERGETILHEVERGEIVMCPAITNRGKTTFWRNVALSLACGRAFPPIAREGKPRSILYLDFETRLWRLRADINRMLGQLTQAERALVSENLHLVCDCRIDDRPLTLSNPRHLELLEADARRCGADVIVVDTLTAAFEIENENDNAEGSRIMKKLTGLAQRLNCVVVFLHHIGKAKQEEGQTSQIVHRGRGGSSYSGFSHAIFNLVADPVSRERVTLECAKIKGERFQDTVLNLDLETRWFVSAGAVVKTQSPYEQVLGVFNGAPLKRAAIMDRLPDLARGTLDRCLREAVDAGDLIKEKGGAYRRFEKFSISHAYRDENLRNSLETTQDVEDSLNFGDSDNSGDDGIDDPVMAAIER